MAKTTKNTYKSTTSPKKSKRTSKKKKTLNFGKLSNFFKNENFRLGIGLFLFFISLILFISYFSFLIQWYGFHNDDYYRNLSFIQILRDQSVVVHNWGGRLGAAISFLMVKQWFGVIGILIPFYMLIVAIRTVFRKSLFNLQRLFFYSTFFLLWFSTTLGFIFSATKHEILGGVFGFEASSWLKGILGIPGTILILLFAALAFVFIILKPDFSWIKNLIPKRKISDKLDIEEQKEQDEEPPVAELIDEIQVLEKKDTATKPIDLSTSIDSTNNSSEITDTKESSEIEMTIENLEKNGTVKQEEHSDKEHFGIDTIYDPKLDLRDYKLPGIDLLNKYDEDIKVHQEELEANKDRIIKTLDNYAIKIDKIKATIGPTVTLYEIVPAPGVRISKIKNLEDDIALSLSALGIRIIAPIPGKGTIGIEVPNRKPETVSMRSILTSEKFRNADMELPIGLGKTIANESYIADLTKMPHLLMAGATGQGKSVGLNVILTSLLYKKHPSQIKFILVDPKKVELSLFSKIERHYLAKLPDLEEAILTDTKQVVRTLNSLTIEMDQRYDLLKSAQVRNIKEYNQKFVKRKLSPKDGHRFLPYLILVVDEFADLIMTAGKEIESPIARLAQLARAIGIHLIIATQRPSVNIITGTIKANFPARLAFRVTSKIDSRTILDTGGADQLIGRGDLLLSTGSDIIRLQCPFVDTPEIDRLTEFIGSQRAYPEAFLLPEVEDDDTALNDFDAADRDDLFEEAARIIVTHQHGSTSLLQRKLKLGYNRAGRIIDQLEAAGIVGSFEGSKAREVLIKDDYSLEQFLKDNL